MCLYVNYALLQKRVRGFEMIICRKIVESSVQISEDAPKLTDQLIDFPAVNDLSKLVPSDTSKSEYDARVTLILDLSAPISMCLTPPLWDGSQPDQQTLLRRIPTGMRERAVFLGRTSGGESRRETSSTPTQRRVFCKQTFARRQLLNQHTASLVSECFNVIQWTMYYLWKNTRYKQRRLVNKQHMVGFLAREYTIPPS